MIVSVFLRHYKVYNGIYFIPITIKDDFSVYFGANGIGKSSILEAFDSYFNNRPWNLNKTAKPHITPMSNRPYIVPVFIINKAGIKMKKDDLAKAEKLSDAFWNLRKDDIDGNPEELMKFIDFRDSVLKHNYSPYEDYLFLLGKYFDEYNEKVSFGPFHYQKNFLTLINIEYSEKEKGESRDEWEKNIDNQIQKLYFGILELIMGLYSYIYIPSDIDVQNYTKLENQDIQKLMHKDIQDEIRNAISDKKLEEINNSLKTFVDGISDRLKDYEYRKPTDGVSNIAMSDMISKIIETYFSIRVLNKKIGDNKIPVNQLSSGEKRRALVDLAYAFLNEKEKHEKKIILGIDEPEVSLHISACFEQFEKLRKIASNSHQVIITTHWYGFLPIVNVGLSHNVYFENDKIQFATYSLENYREEIRLTKQYKNSNLPFDIHLKSTNDLMQSIITSLMADKCYNYILCEGSSDAIYLKYYLSQYQENDNLRILPLGGCDEVVTLLQKIMLSISSDKYIKKEVDIKGKVLGLIDTDTHYNHQIIQSIQESDKSKIKFRRILFDKNYRDIKLVGAHDNNIVETQIEHVLEPKVFLDTIKSYKREDLDSIFNAEKIDVTAKCSYNMIDFKESEREIVRNFFAEDDCKVNFAKKYTEFARQYTNIPTFISEIIKLFDFKTEKLNETIQIEAPKKKRVVVVRKKKV